MYKVKLHKSHLLWMAYNCKLNKTKFPLITDHERGFTVLGEIIYKHRTWQKSIFKKNFVTSLKHNWQKVSNLLALKQFTIKLTDGQNNILDFQATGQLEKRWNGANTMWLLHWFEAGCQRHELHDHALIRPWSIY